MEIPFGLSRFIMFSSLCSPVFLFGFVWMYLFNVGRRIKAGANLLDLN